MAKKKTETRTYKTPKLDPDFIPEEGREVAEPTEGMAFFSVEVPGVPGCPYIVMASDESNAWSTFLGCTGVRGTDQSVKITPYALPVYADTPRLGDERYEPPLTRAKQRLAAAKEGYVALS